MSQVPLEEIQYINLVQRILDKGTLETTRNGVTKSVFGECMRFSLADGTMPLLTSKKVAWKAVFHELMWFVRGDVHNQTLNDLGVHIWDGNASRAFLDGRGLQHYPEGFLGPIYGWQWRRWGQDTGQNPDPSLNLGIVGAEFPTHEERSPKGIDQLQQVIDALKDPAQRSSRRLLISAWNPQQLDEMALPPCHVLMQFHVREGQYLSCALYQRSGDVGLGVPFNIASYAFLTHILAKHCGLTADELVYFLGDAHIYEAHLEPLRQQVARELFPFPKIRIRTQHERIDDYTLDEVEWVEPYQFNKTIKMAFVA